MFPLLTTLSLILIALFYDHLIPFLASIPLPQLHHLPLHLLLNPLTLSLIVLFAFILLKELFTKGNRLSSVHRCINHHLITMSRRQIDQVWEGFSPNLRSTLTDQRRLKKGESSFYGKARVAHYALYFSKLYKNGSLDVSSIHQVQHVRRPKMMYMVRLRCKSTQKLRMTIWISRTPNTQDRWSIEEVCIHPTSGSPHRGETLTGARMKTQMSSSRESIAHRPPAHSSFIPSSM